ncbi:MAG TPA: LysR family transcriptional regulator [Caulobacteraceae bacterium]|nr:LysR family transcriptional regulator [Caulobacteraceae bacterium]
MRQVIAVQRYGSFAKAADALGMSQPALSRSIARLEDELGVQMFRRSASGAQITPAGELVAERAASVIAETEALARDVALIAGGETGQVRVGASYVLRHGFVQDLMLRIAERHPNLRLHAEVNDRASLISRLKSRQLDIVFTGALQDPALAVTRVATFEIIVIAAPGHPLAGRRDVPREEFSAHRNVGPPAALMYGLFGLVETDALSFHTTNDYDTIIAFVKAGIATAVVPAFLAHPMIQSGELVQVDVKPRAYLDFVAATTQAAAGAPMLQKLIGYAMSWGETLRAPDVPPRPAANSGRG